MDKNKFCAARHDGTFPGNPASFQDANSFWMIFQPLRSWLISGVPLGQVRTKFHESEVRKIVLALQRKFGAWKKLSV